MGSLSPSLEAKAGRGEQRRTRPGQALPDGWDLDCAHVKLLNLLVTPPASSASFYSLQQNSLITS